ncbi:hypothetical protein F5J12DRAFT_298331 [Pisolithus orientalis]|uniref:uncharacterized protein n=1 Tax=Pisolithus orientalis TaxID=936130 RepID=UPI002224C4BD|nr:uncharacterized protein F5J12DRAFT_298331 [Pisolithus orientalis]KAI6030564.1 hypothetical protein F5J12DRAFT_298331 [Pisolithus orientalis]
MYPDQPKLTFSLSTLLTCSCDESNMFNGAVRDTYLAPTQLACSPDPTCSGYGERRGDSSSQLHHQGLVGNDPCSFSDSVRYTSGQSQKGHSCTVFTPDTITWDAELDLARVGDADTVLPQNAVQEVTHGYRASYCTGTPTNYSNCPSTSCLHLCVDGTLCLQEISCATVPSHFVGHGVKKKSRKKAVRCMWEGCVKTVARHSFVRHVREKHLGHVRERASTTRRTNRATSLIPLPWGMVCGAIPAESEYICTRQYFETTSHL